MAKRFRHAAIVGKHQAQGMRELLDELAQFLVREGLDVSFEHATARNTGLTGYGAMTPPRWAQHCDLAVVVGGDGTMLGIARELARHDIPLVGINQGRLGFITDIPVGQFREALAPMVAGDYEEEHRSMLEGGVWRDGQPHLRGPVDERRGGQPRRHRQHGRAEESTSATSSSPTCAPTA